MDNSSTKWSKSIKLSKSSGTILTLYTSNNFIDKNIELQIDAQTASPNFDGGNLNSKSASAVFTNATTSSTNSSGVTILTKGSAGRDAVLFNGAVNGWVNKSDNANALRAVSASTWNGTNYYLTGVTLGNGKSFDITVPNGNSDPITYHFSVDSNGNTTIT